MYGIFGAEDILRASSVHVRKEIQLVADGVEIPLPPDSQGIILLNIDSYAGGVPLWTHGVKNAHRRPDHSPLSLAHSRSRRSRSLSDFELTLERVDSSENLLRDMMPAEEKFAHVTACSRPSSCQDGYLDVVSIRGAFHLGQIKVGLSNAQRLCQCREATITIRNKVAVHVDGEPWRQRAATLTIRRKKEPAVMLHRSVDDWGVEMEMSKLLDWAEERKMIDGQVHSILMKEFSRRIESKTRQYHVNLKKSYKLGGNGGHECFNE
jgi:diacylglycerol kinase (ATP)